MNQILVTGDEVIREPVKKQKKVLPINGIVLFYAICVIILGICIIAGSFYAKQKINETVEASIQPEIEIQRDDDNNEIKISATHIRGITNLTYQWNDEEEITIDAGNQKNVTTTIDLIGGENTLKISVTEENGKTKTLEKTFIAGNIPEIALEGIANGVKVIVTSEENIDYVQYCWDDEEVQKIEIEDKKEYEGIINAPAGEHTLKIEVADINGIKAEKEQRVIGDTEPTLKIESKFVNGNPTFVIDVEDDQSLTMLEISHNGGETQVIDLNAPTYHHEVIMTEGQNTLIVRVTNINGLQKAHGVKVNN